MSMFSFVRTTQQEDFRSENLNNISHYRKNEQIKITKEEVRTILLVGKSRSGKTTALNMFKDPTFVNPDPKLFSETRDPQLYNCHFEALQTHFLLRIIDTPGLQEQVASGSLQSARSDDVIENIIIDCANFNVNNLDLIFITINISVGMPKDEFTILSRLSKLFKEAKGKLCLLISGFEQKSGVMKENFKNDLSKHPDFIEYASLFGDNIFFTGAITESMVSTTNSEQFKSILDNIQEMRYVLFNKIVGPSTPISVFEFESFVDRKTQITTNLQLLEQNEVSYIQGLDNGRYKSAIDTLKELQRFMSPQQKVVYSKFEHVFKNKNKYSIVYIIEKK